MSLNSTHVETSLLFKTARAPIGKLNPTALKGLMTGLGLHVTSIRSQANEYILIDCDAVQVLIASCNFPFPLDHFKGVTRPVEAQDQRENLQRKLANHQSSLTIIVSDSDRLPAAETCRLACLETLDLLISTCVPDLVYWAENDRLLTADEAELLIAELELNDHSAVDDFDWESIKPSELRAPRVGNSTPNRGQFIHAPDLSNEVMAWFSQVETPPDPDPESDLQKALSSFLDLQGTTRAQRLADTAVGRSSLYVMSATIMVFALPVGATALTYNALSGGSLRATAHMMALTGFGLALTAIGMPSPATALEYLL